MSIQKPILLSAIMIALGLATVSTGLNATAAEDDAKTVQLVNGKDLTGWTHYLWDLKAGKEDTTTTASAVWTVEDGVLKCKGRPTGYLRTEKEYENYKLEVQWRWEPGSAGGNSGVLVHTTTPNALGQWPKSIEVQLFRGNAGDFWVIGTTLDVPNVEERRKGRRHLNLTDDSEKPIGEWNTMEIVCQGNEITVHVNGDLVNHATNCSATRGAISLQSEGAPVQFRKVALTPL